ncbi:MAG: L-serine ammonia-lyase [Ancalomicrobiaceae bacterium]|nr:L-serine ammonia-lyase [Ancalomicrobiaceae bacterium]
MISLFDLFKIGIGPSSSHTIGPMKAAKAFVDAVVARGHLAEIARIEVRLYGSLAWTGRGHATDKAVVLGLIGEVSETVDPDCADALVAEIGTSRTLKLHGRAIGFDCFSDIVFDTLSPTPGHPNTLRFAAFAADGSELFAELWHSVGGGFVLREGEAAGEGDAAADPPFPYRTSAGLLAAGKDSGLSIAEMVMANEAASRPRADVVDQLNRVAAAMFACIERGMRGQGLLPGGLNVARRAKAFAQRLSADKHRNMRAPHEIIDYVSLYALAVNEENAGGGRVVTAPTNGAAGVIPATLRYYRDFIPGANEEGIRTFLLTATAIGGLFKLNASISGAEVGCQGEVGVAASMAAGGLAAVMGGTNAQVENAAEIAMEHHLGMTCDPIGGLVQIPCIERNAFGAVKAITAASMALRGDGIHKVSLDEVIVTMRETGRDMASKYKETSLGGLAVNVTEC